MKVEFSDPEVTRFYCDTEQAFLAEATWLHFTGCLYFLPKLFAVPAFRPALEALFPDPSLTFTYLLRSLMLPRDNVWQQVKEHDIALFANVDTRVGIQVCLSAYVSVFVQMDFLSCLNVFVHDTARYSSNDAFRSR